MASKKTPTAVTTSCGAPCTRPTRCTQSAPQCHSCLDRAYKVREAGIKRGKASPAAVAVREPHPPARLKPAPSRPPPLPFDGAQEAARKQRIREQAILSAMDTADPVRRRTILERAQSVARPGFVDEAMSALASSPPNMPRALDDAIARVKAEMGEEQGTRYLRVTWLAGMARSLWRHHISGYIAGLVRDHFRPGRFALTEEGWRRFVEGARVWKGWCVYLEHLSAMGVGWREVGSGRRMAIALQAPLMSDAQIAEAVRVVDPGRTERAAEWSVYDAISELRDDRWGIERRVNTGRPAKRENRSAVQNGDRIGRRRRSRTTKHG